MQQLASELSELCDRYGLPDYAYPAKFFGGLEMVKCGIFATGLQQMADALEGLRQIGNRFNRTYFLSLFAQAQAQSEAIQAALQSIERAQQLAIDSHEFLWKAELTRQTGEFYKLLKYDPIEVEHHFLTALHIARQQTAKSLELRAAMSLARLWQMQGRQTFLRCGCGLSRWVMTRARCVCRCSISSVAKRATFAPGRSLWLFCWQRCR